VSIELLFTAIGTISAVATSTAILAYWLGRKFAEIEKRFAEIDRRFEYVDKKFEEINRRFERVDKRFEEVESRLEEVVRRVMELVERFDDLAQATRDQFEFFAEFLGFRGVLEARDVEFVKAELGRLSRLNPLTEEELRRIRELVEKEELTLEEADELRELARKFVKEHGNVPGAWKLLIYASIMRGIALRKRRQREGSQTS